MKRRATASGPGPRSTLLLGGLLLVLRGPVARGEDGAAGAAGPEAAETCRVLIHTAPAHGPLHGGVILLQPAPDGAPGGKELADGVLIYRKGTVISARARAFVGFSLYELFYQPGSRREERKNSRVWSETEKKWVLSDAIESIRVESDVYVNADFTCNPGTLQLTVQPAESGTVRLRPAPPGSSTPETNLLAGVCVYAPKTLVTLTAQPKPGFRFCEFYVDPGYGPYHNPQAFDEPEVILSLERSGRQILARFEPDVYTLRVEISGYWGSGGTVTVTPRLEGQAPFLVHARSEHQRASYEAALPAGTRVDLKAQPNERWWWEGWSGDVRVDANPLTVVMDADRVLRASFKDRTMPYLNYELDPEEGGTLQAEPKGYPVSRRSLRYGYGEEVTLVPAANAGYAFQDWSGDLQESTREGERVTFKMDRNRKVALRFRKAPEAAEPEVGRVPQEIRLLLTHRGKSGAEGTAARPARRGSGLAGALDAKVTAELEGVGSADPGPGEGESRVILKLVPGIKPGSAPPQVTLDVETVSSDLARDLPQDTLAALRKELREIRSKLRDEAFCTKALALTDEDRAALKAGRPVVKVLKFESLGATTWQGAPKELELTFGAR